MKIVGITACTAGIAHTYMAQAAMEKKASELGYECKVETQGAMGIENELTSEEIKAADIVIIGADIGVENMERFDGKIVFETTVSDVVSKIDGVFEKALKLL